MSNQSNINKARKALLDYDEAGTDETDVTDILADLMHFCKAEDFNFEHCLARARDHFYEEELEETENQDNKDARDSYQGISIPLRH